MGTDVVRQITAEEWEFKRKSIELCNLEGKLAQRELELATFQGELRNFQARYLMTIGSRYWELDELEAQIAEAQVRLKPDDWITKQKAEQARVQAEESAKTARNNRELKKKPDSFKPTDSIKKLYREIAKRIHPDLATDDQDRVRYQKIMAKANQAYQEGDEIGLRNILHQWKSNPGLEKDHKLQSKLAQIDRQLNQIQDRLREIEIEINEMRKSSLNQLKLKVETAEINGLNFLSEMARFLDQQILIARETLAQTKAKGNEAFVK